MKQFFHCECEHEGSFRVEAESAERAAEIYAHGVYYDGDPFAELAVTVTDPDGEQHALTVRAEPVETIEFSAESA